MDVWKPDVLDHEEGGGMLTQRFDRRFFMQWPARVQAGFTLIELLITLMIVAVLLLIGIPNLSQWIRSSAVGAMGESVQNGLRRAQIEAVSRNIPIEFALVTGTPSASNFTEADLPATADGTNWVVRAVENATDVFIQGFVGADVSPDIAVVGPASIFFAGFGRAQDSSGALLAGTQVFRITHADSDRVMCVYVTPGAAIKMCNPNLSSGTAGACLPQLSASACPGS